jgi:hypothetical protein
MRLITSAVQLAGRDSGDLPDRDPGERACGDRATVPRFDGQRGQARPVSFG